MKPNRKVQIAAAPGHPAPHGSSEVAAGNLSPLAYGLALTGAFIAAAAAGMLSAEHLGWFSNHLPGCAPGSGCEQAAKSVFGSLPFQVPGVGEWSVAFAGFAYFVAVLCTLLIVGPAVPAALARITAVGLILSIFYLVVIMTHLNQYVCKYCLGAHAGNILLWASVMFGASDRRRRPRGSLKALASVAVLFLGVSAGLGAVQARVERANVQHGEDVLNDEIKAMQADAQRKADEAARAAQEKERLDNQARAQAEQPKAQAVPPNTPPAGTPAAAPAAGAVTPYDIGLPIPGDDTLAPLGFTGRYRLGPAKAPIRIVSFSDYQCPDCARVEKEIHALLKDNPNISFSHKYWAFNHNCNKYYEPEPGKGDMHPNACWAARAADAAGMLHGNAGFWRMHYWLFEHTNNGQAAPGAFTEPELQSFLASQGWDAAEFTKVMTGPDTLKHVQEDIEQAQNAGIMFTPMVFVNGREFRGWQATDGVKRYVEALAKTNPPPSDAMGDSPVDRLEKQIQDWQVSPRAPLTRNPFPSFTRGPADAKVRIVMFGDYRDEWTPKMWAEVVRLTKDRTDTSIEFRPRPVKETCNVIGPEPDTLPSCWMARAVEAAGRIGGVDAFWKMHDWLVAQADKFDVKSLPEGAKAAGLDYDKLRADMVADEMMNILIMNYKTFQRAGGRAVPCVFINERYVWRWTLDDTPILDKIIERAAQGK